jgi:hypothetical protein
LQWPEMGDRRRERETPARGEGCSGLCYGENTSTVHRCSWCLWSVRSMMESSCGCDWPDLQIDRTVRMNRFDRVWRGAPNSRYTGWRGATGSKLRLFQGLRCVWVLI